MTLKARHCVRSLFKAAVLGGLCMPVILLLTGGRAQAPPTAHHVYLAFGFHGNLYHSFRNDTDDEDGFGKDIRVIRHIIATLDHWNQRGVPVKAVWDFDNLFSLQDLLPKHAPDIIDNVRRRIGADGDEAILMSYNNGLVSAMNRQELTDAVRWAVTNPWHSGIQDVFGSYDPIVRPQEMMTTPGDFSIYKRLGIRAVALYYSATPFDAFRVFSRPLTRTEAYNPILYKHPQTGEEMVVIPSYHIGDLVEHVSLRNWVEQLHRLQEQGELTRDALIFLNYDADSDFWSGVDVPWPLGWLPNTQGLDALIRDVKDLPYVRFTTLNPYLQNHPTAGTFYFSQDTADGSFDGYNSWAEKARVSPQWTSIERSRRMQAAARKAMTVLGNPPDLADLGELTATAELVRLRALSTTHFGMATPFVAPQRELAADELIARLDRCSDAIEARISSALRDDLRRRTPPDNSGKGLRWLDSFMLLQTEAADNQNGRFLKLRLSGADPAPGPYVLGAPDGTRLPAITCGPVRGPDSGPWLRLYVPGQHPLADGVYDLYQAKGPGARPAGPPMPVRSDARGLSNGRLELRLDTAGRVEGIYLDGVRQAESRSLMPYLRYNDQVVQIPRMHQQRFAAADGRWAGVRLQGDFPDLPADRQAAGDADYTIGMLADRPYLLLHGRIDYPATDRHDVIKAGAPGLSRRADLRWREVAPAEIRFAPRSTRQNPVRILKRNYLGVETQYALDYFRHSPANLNLADVNNHITQSYVALVSGGYGLAIAMDTTVQANFAFAPLKMTYDARQDSFQIRANPFGTYFGRQYRPPTWGNGQGYEMTLYTGEQLASAAPTYNGAAQDFDLLIVFFKGGQLPERIKADMLAYAHPPLAVSLKAAAPDRRPPPLPPKKPMGFAAAYQNGAVHFFWDCANEPGGLYRIYCGTRPGHYERIYAATGNSLKTKEFLQGQPFGREKRYYARIEAVAAKGHESTSSEEISFQIHPPADLQYPRIPLGLKIRALWSNVLALIDDSTL
jgi:hypothetical protein